jgi:hypothetical protein
MKAYEDQRGADAAGASGSAPVITALARDHGVRA